MKGKKKLLNVEAQDHPTANKDASGFGGVGSGLKMQQFLEFKTISVFRKQQD